MIDVPARTPLLVVGAGPAGLAASLQARREAVGHVTVGTGPPGGLVAAAWRIDNLPGYQGGVTGTGLSRRLARQAWDAELPLVDDEVTAVAMNDGTFVAGLASGKTIEARTMILATGTRPVPWPVAGASSLARSGRLHRDVRTLPARLGGKQVIVLGGGDAALDSALSVRRRGGRATVLVRSEGLKASTRLVARAGEAGVDLRMGSPVEEATIEDGLVRLLPLDLLADHVVVCIGRVPEDALYRMLLPATALPSSVPTPIDGLFVAGDIIAGHDRFIASAMGDGQRAALFAARFLGGRADPTSG